MTNKSEETNSVRRQENQAKLAHQVNLPRGYPYSDQKTRPLPRLVILLFQMTTNLIWVSQYLVDTEWKSSNIRASPGRVSLLGHRRPEGHSCTIGENTSLITANSYSRHSSSPDSKFTSLILFPTTHHIFCGVHFLYCHRLNRGTVLLSCICDVNKHHSDCVPPN